MYFPYGDKETEYLKKQDEQLAFVIDRLGHVYRSLDPDLFSSVLHHIIGQQISTKAQTTVWNRMHEHLGDITPASVHAAALDELQQLGMTFRKAGYIKDFAARVLNGEFDLDAVEHMSDKDAIAALSDLKGIGRWTAEMILMFCLKRPDILSYDDLAIQRGMRMTFQLQNVDRRLFEQYRRKFTPYNSTASLYFWAVSAGELPELTDPLSSIK